MGYDGHSKSVGFSEERPSSQQGSLMLELVIACMLVALVLPLVVDITANLSRRHTASLNYIEHHSFS